MKCLLICGLFLALLGSVSGCDKAVAPAEPLTCSFQMLNEQGQGATVFPLGQNFIFRFQVTNTSDQDIYVDNPVIDTREFLEVFSIAEKQQVSVGRPYSGIFCEYVSGYTIAAHKAMLFNIPWVAATSYQMSFPFCGHAPTTYLPTGHYRTAFRPVITWSFQGQGPASSKTTTFKEFAREFEVK
jgi:hypothetical protein